MMEQEISLPSFSSFWNEKTLIAAYAKDYFVAKDQGNDAISEHYNRCFRTLERGGSVLLPGYTLYL